MLTDLQREALELLDGERTVEQAVFDWCRERQTVEVQPLLTVLDGLQEAGLATVDDPEQSGLVEPRRVGRAVLGVCVWRRCSETLRRALCAMAVLPFPPALAVVALALLVVGAVRWVGILRAATPLLLAAIGSYWLGLLYLLGLCFIFSWVGAIARIAVHRRFGLPCGTACFTLTWGLPSVAVETMDRPELTRWQRLWLHLSGPTAEGAVAGAAALLTMWPLLEGATQPLYAAATVGFLRVFVALCPWRDGALTRGVASALMLPDLRVVALRLLMSRLWRALSHPRDQADQAGGPYAVYMIVWAAVALRFVQWVIAPQLPSLLSDLADGLPPAEAVGAALFLVVLLALVTAAMVGLGLVALLALGRWIVTHSLWSHPVYQLLGVLALVAAANVGLHRLLPDPAAALPLARGLGVAGAVLAVLAGLLVVIHHRASRMAMMALPLGCAALSAGAALLTWQHLPEVEGSRLPLLVAYLLGLAAVGWGAYLWRWRSAYLCFAGLSALFLVALLAPDACPACVPLTFVAGAVLTVGVLCGQVRSRLAPMWLLIALSSLTLAAGAWNLPGSSEAGGLPFDTCLVGLMLAGALMQWLWGAWSGRLAEHPLTGDPASTDDLAAHLTGQL
ncbi:MAG: hypothetical protein KKI08_17730, partial [Armatimonadetes bacterium]|nr:hypothetical protein [Armatimonadota bacterium]